MSVWLGAEPLVLASGSATRLALLRAAGLPVEVVPPPVDERAIELSLGRPAPPDLAARLARDKALAVGRGMPGRWVVGADQVLDRDGVPIPKAATPDAAIDTLLSLAGRAHRLHSAFALVMDGAVVRQGTASATLAMRVLDRAAIGRYVQAAGEAATRSAGGYEIEGLGLHLFERVEGQHSTILGLPMLPLLAALRDLGLLGV